MNFKRLLLPLLALNLLWLAVLGGAFVLSSPAQAGAPALAQAGPYYATFSGADFHSYRFDFEISRSSYAVVRGSNFGIGVTGLHLPPGATITALMNDSETVADGDVVLLLMRCPIGSSNCSEVDRATQDAGNRSQVTKTLNHLMDMAGYAYFLQINLDDDSAFYFARVAYTLPAPIYLPAVQR